MKRHIFFIIRYSVYSQKQSSWSIGDKVSSEEYRNRLFAAPRLDLHEKLFSRVTLPALDAISESVEMSALLMTSSELPPKYREELDRLSESRPWLKIIEVDSDRSLIKAIDRSVRDAIAPMDDDGIYATVRLDDDDALANDFGLEVEKYLDFRFSGMCLSFAKGVLGVHDGDVYRSLYQYHMPKNAQGMTFITTKADAQAGNMPFSVFATGNHRTVDRRYPTVSDARRMMYIRTEHGESDLVAHGRARDKEDMKPLTDEDLDELKARFDRVKDI